MKKQNIVITGFFHAAAAMVYVALVAFVMTHASGWFGKEDTQLTAMAVLMLLVLSAAIMASLTFLRPVLWYIDNKKREALWLLAWTIGFFFVLTLLVFVCLAVIR